MRKTSGGLGNDAAGSGRKEAARFGAFTTTDTDRSLLLAAFMIVLLSSMIAAAVAMAVI